MVDRSISSGEGTLVQETYWDRLQHELNPIQIYPVLIKKGFTPKKARGLAEIYEKVFFNLVLANNGKKGLVPRVMGIKEYFHHGDSKFLNTLFNSHFDAKN